MPSPVSALWAAGHREGGGSVTGLVTAASFWNAGTIGVAGGFGRANIAIILCVISLLSLWLLTSLNKTAEDGKSVD